MLLVTWRQLTFSQTLEGTAKGPTLLIHPGSAFFTGPPREMVFQWLRIPSWWRKILDTTYFVQRVFNFCSSRLGSDYGFSLLPVCLFPRRVRCSGHPQCFSFGAPPSGQLGILFPSELHAFLLPAFMVTFRRQSGWDVITSSSPARGS